MIDLEPGLVTDRTDGDVGQALDVLSTTAIDRPAQRPKAFLPRPVSRALIRAGLDRPGRLGAEPPADRAVALLRLRRPGSAAQLGEVARRGDAGRHVGEAIGAEQGRHRAQGGRGGGDLGGACRRRSSHQLTNRESGVDLENYGAACCAVQNLMLPRRRPGWPPPGAAAQSPWPGRARAGRRGEEERMVGLIRLGYPDPGRCSQGDGQTRPWRRRPTKWLVFFFFFFFFFFFY